VVLTGAGVAIAGSMSSSDPKPDSYIQWLREQAPRPAAPSAEQRTSFGALRRARTTADDLPRASGEIIDGSIRGVNTSLSRRLRHPGKMAIWLTVGDGVVCMATLYPGEEGVTSTCQSTAHAAEGWLMGTAFGGPIPAGTTVVTGVVPDGVAEVEAIHDDGRKTKAPVVDNAYSFEVEGSFTLSFTDRAGNHRELSRFEAPQQG